jgi:hypothetical protein
VTCKDLQYEIDKVLDGRAPVDALFHLAICAPCRALVAQLRSFHRSAANTPRPSAPVGLRSEIAGALNDDPLRERLGRLESPPQFGEDSDELRFFR